jgi:hypothetical protein
MIKDLSNQKQNCVNRLAEKEQILQILPGPIFNCQRLQILSDDNNARKKHGDEEDPEPTGLVQRIERDEYLGVTEEIDDGSEESDPNKKTRPKLL